MRTLCFAANLETIHTRGSSVYGVLELEESHFTLALWQKKTREFETDSSVCGDHVYWKPVIVEQLVCESEEGNPRD